MSNPYRNPYVERRSKKWDATDRIKKEAEQPCEELQELVSWMKKDGIAKEAGKFDAVVRRLKAYLNSVGGS